MKKTLLSLFIMLAVCSESISQRTLEMLYPAGYNTTQAVLNDTVYMTGYHSETLTKFDGRNLTPYFFPRIDGERLRLARAKELLSYNNKLYCVLERAATGDSYLYSFDGSDFSLVLTEPVGTNTGLRFFADRIYTLARTPDGVKLFSYDGSTLTEIPGYTFPTTESPTLLVAGDYLYYQSMRYDYVVRYDGSSFRVLTELPLGLTLKAATANPGSEDVYFEWQAPELGFSSELSFFDGSSHNFISIDRPSIIGHAVFVGNTFYAVDVSGDDFRLIQCIDGDCHYATVPDDILIGSYQVASYRGNLHLAMWARGTGRSYHYIYDGTSFFRLIEIGPTDNQVTTRQDKLLITPDGPLPAYEYNGTYYIRIDPPIVTPGSVFALAPLVSTSCFHTWELWGGSPSGVAIEIPDSTCIPPAASSTFVIPDRLRDYHRFDMRAYARDRDWCWTGIDVDWDIEPLCLVPPCPFPSTMANLSNAQGKTVWQKTFDKPFNEPFNIKDSDPYSLSVSVEKDKAFERVLLLDQNLVNKGIEAVSFEMYPKQGFFNLTVDTEKQQEIPFTLSLRTTKGESVWQENFTAPIDKVIQARTQKPGDYLQLSLLQKPSSVSYYPNPFNGSLKLDVPKESLPVTISLSDLNGKMISQKIITDPGQCSFEVGNQKPGLYLLNIMEGKNERHELVQIIE